MPILPDSKRLFTLFLNKLNDNTLGVNFDGNFMFRFWQQQANVADFEIIVNNPETLTFEGQEVVPVVNVQNVDIPFVERNKRNDYESEFYVAIKIPTTVSETNQRTFEFNEVTNQAYQALLEALEGIRENSVEDIDGYKYALKVREPQKVNVFRYNGTYYQVLSISLNLSSIEQGLFGNQFRWYLKPTGANGSPTSEPFWLDVIEATIVSAKNNQAFNQIDTTNSEQFVTINSRAWTAQVTVNYLGTTIDQQLINEALAVSTNDILKTYELHIVPPQGHHSSDIIKTVIVTNINTVLSANSVVRLTFTLERIQ